MAEGAVLRLQACKPVDIADCYVVSSDKLTPSLHATTVCFHPIRPLLAVAASNTVAVYDLLTNTRLNRHDIRTHVVEMAFTPDTGMLVLVLQDTVIVGLSLATNRIHTLVSKHERSGKPVEHCLLALSGGSKASLFFCKYGKEAVRRAPLSEADVLDAKGRPVRAKEGSWGVKMKLEPVKPITGLCVLPHDSQLLVLHADGGLRSYATNAIGADALNPVWQVSAHDVTNKGLPAPGQLLAVPHPVLPSTYLIIQACRMHSLCVIQIGTGSNIPAVLYKGKVPGVPLILGAGVVQDTCQIVVVGLLEAGRVRAAAVHLGDLSASASLTLSQTNKVEPLDFGHMLDPRHPTQHLLMPSSLAPAPEYNATIHATAAPINARRTAVPRPSDALLGLAAPTSAGDDASGAKKAVEQDKSQAEAIAAANALGSVVHSIWSAQPAWAQSVTHSSVLLAGQLLPQPAHVVMHPFLPLMAVQLRPSPQLQASSVGMRYSLAGASPEEFMLSRKLLSVPILNASSWESMVSAGAARAMAVPLHSALHHWIPGAGQRPTLGLPPTEPAAGSSQAIQDTKHQSSMKRGELEKSSSQKPGELTKSTSLAKSTSINGGETTKAQSLLPHFAALTLGSGVKHYNLPGNLYYVSDATLCRYNVSNRAVTSVKSFQTKDAEIRRVHSIVSSKAGAWLVFFEITGSRAGTSQERWQWTLLLGSQLDIPVWYKTGKYGVFLGSNETHFAVVDASGRLAAVFAVADCNNAGAVPLYVYQLDGLSLNGISMPVFTGPPRDALPDPNNTAVLGCVVWQSTQGGLAARPLPAVIDPEVEAAKQQRAQERERRKQKKVPLSQQYYSYDYNSSGGSSTDEDEPPPEEEESEEEEADEWQGTGAVAPGSNLGALGPKYWLPLLPGELVIQVCWQSLVLDPTETDEATDKIKYNPWTKTGPTMGAILTNQRVMLVSEMLNLHASILLHDHISTSLPCPGRSLLWCGPVLLVLLVDGRVLHLAWDGAAHAVCHVAPQASTHLVAATHDSLLFLRQVQADTGRGAAVNGPVWEVVARPVNMLQALVIGWSTLALLPNTSTGAEVAQACRDVLRTVVAGSDASATAPSVVWSLLGTCALDLAFALVSQQDGAAESGAYLAAAAAAGEWAAVEQSLTQELERSAHHPAPPPAGSPMHAKLLAAAAGAVAHGQLSRAVNLLSMAGEWRLAMVVSAVAGDTQALYKIAAQAGENQPGGVAISAAAQRLAGAIRAVYGSTASSLYDAKLQLCAPNGSALSTPMSGVPAAGPLTAAANGKWQTGPPHSMVPAHVQVAEKEGMRIEEGGSIPAVSVSHPLVAALALDTSTLKAMNPRTLGPLGDDAGSVSNRPSAAQRVGSSNSLISGQTSPSMSAAPAVAGNPLDDIFGFGLVGDQPISRDPAKLGDGSDSDSDLSTSTGATQQQWKGKVTIRDKAASSFGNPEVLRSMRLAPPPGSGVMPLQPAGLSTNLSPTLSISEQLAPIPAVGLGLGPTHAAALGPDGRPITPDAAFGAAQPPPTTTGSVNPLGGTAPVPIPMDDDIFGDFFSAKPKPAAAGAPAPMPAATTQPAPSTTAFQGLSPALAAGMQQPALAMTTQGLSPALAAGMTSSAPAMPQAPQAITTQSSAASAANFQGLSPALMAGMQQPTQGVSTAGLSPALAAGMVGAQSQRQQPQQAPPAAPAPNVDASQAEPLYFEGVSLLEAGNWPAAEGRFKLSLAALKLHPAGDVRRSKQSFCAQYLAAVMLLAVATAGAGPKEAKLYRYAASLQLDLKHRIALVRESVARNKQQRNSKYCADTLTWLITTLAGTVPDSMLQPLQKDIEDCDKSGGRNANVARDEDLENWAQLVGMCDTAEEVVQLAGPLIASA